MKTETEFMDSTYLIISVLAFWVIYDSLRFQTTDHSKKLKLYHHLSNFIVWIFTSSILFTEGLMILIAVAVIGLPISIYYSYLRYHEDRKSSIISWIITGSILLTVWLYGFYI